MRSLFLMRSEHVRSLGWVRVKLLKNELGPRFHYRTMIRMHHLVKIKP
ncbi:hypothetical protein XBFM1_1910115 [Xenorhabdus bovienii str. feltiae Moldova]|uniref:Uncharacterized protein n=1 Tax=Xenorhabdus bovienii str. feltiae Moldova TaxID=1398200 RepID=A0A077NQY1_XENBV|nr:hypothetical protein XBFM1_1910115 [Xenorhabdus bovienii str. feltiae Moldova]